MARPLAKLLTAFCVLAAVLVVGALVIILSRPPPPLPPLPKPNGYDEFVKAGKMVDERSSDYRDMSEAELRGLVSTNAEALKVARIGLSRECRVPLEFTPTEDKHFLELPQVKRLAFMLAAEGKLAELEKRPGDAACSYLDAVRIGHALSRGGVIIDSLVGVAVQAIGTQPLERLVPRLDVKQCRELAAALETIESKRESSDDVLNQEHAWSRRTYGLKGQFIRLVTYRSLKQMEDKLAAKLKAQQARAQLLLVQAAARAYELEKGQRPKTLDDLVPAYLKAIPQDPVTGTNLNYRP